MAGCRGASSCHVRCGRVSSRLIVLQRMYIHVPRSLCTGGRWERTCEDRKLRRRQPCLAQLPASFQLACLSHASVQGTSLSCLLFPPCRAYSCSHSAGGTLQHTVELASCKGHEFHPPLTSPSRKTRRRLCSSSSFSRRAGQGESTTVRWPCAGQCTSRAVRLVAFPSSETS